MCEGGGTCMANTNDGNSSTKSERQSKVPKLIWDASNITTSYANVCNVNSTQEEMVFFMGVNDIWDAELGELTIKLENRVVMSPFAAKRLLLILNSVIEGYENSFGELKPAQP